MENLPSFLVSSQAPSVLKHVRKRLQHYYAKAQGWESPLVSRKASNDFARLARRLLGESIGLVLGGGGARGLSHVGIIQAFEEAGIPIDMVGGTSIGSFVGGLYARDAGHVAVYGRAKAFAGRMASKWRMALDLTYPITSWFTGHEFNRTIWKSFGERQIEDLWLPYYCVTTNITHSRMEIHQKGYLWRYVRASMSLSGFLPPLCDNGNMLLDGGYTNILPADIMKSFGAKYVLAVDVASEDDTSPSDFGDTVSGWYLFFQRLLGRSVGIPSLADIQSKLAFVSSVQKLEATKTMPNVIYIRPPVEKFATLDFMKFDDITALGYDHGKKIVKNLQGSGIFDGISDDMRTKGQKRTRRNSV